MKWIAYLVVILGMLGFAYYYPLPNICDKAVSYTIGNIDSRFNLTKAQVLEHIQEAERYWESATSQDLFTYDPAADKPVTIQMVYDERQAIASQINTEKQDVNQDKSSLQSRVDSFKSRSNELDNRVQAFNKKVSNWNKSSSQTEEDYSKLVNEQSELEQLAKQLNAEAKTLQLSTNDVNTKIDELNGNITTLKTIVKTKPEEGLYESASRMISIYYNNSKQELIHTIEHELGHSIGVDHISNPLAIMYVQTNETLVPTADDLRAVNLVCKKETVIDRIRTKRWTQTVRTLLNGIMRYE